MGWMTIGILLAILACVAGNYLSTRKIEQKLDQVLKELEKST